MSQKEPPKIPRDARLITASDEEDDTEYSTFSLLGAANKDKDESTFALPYDSNRSEAASNIDSGSQLICEEVKNSIPQEFLTDDLLPEGEQVHLVLGQLDTTIKLEMLLNQFHSVLFWLSVNEFALLVLLIFFFLRAPGQMWFFLLNAPHLCRGILGFQIEQRVPASHIILDAIRLGSDEEDSHQLTFAQFERRMQSDIIEVVKHEYTRIQHKLRAYFILTLVCGVCDSIGFLIELIKFAKLAGDERADVLLIVTCYVFIILDFFYVCWVANMTQTLPEKYKEHAVAAILGFGNKFKQEL